MPPDRVVTGEDLLWLRAIAYAAYEIVGAFKTTLPATILIVDDDQASRSSLSDALIAEGHQVIEAESGARALQVLRGQQIELALLSGKLPDKSGVELCREAGGFSGGYYFNRLAFLANVAIAITVSGTTGFCAFRMACRNKINPPEV